MQERRRVFLASSFAAAGSVSLFFPVDNVNTRCLVDAVNNGIHWAECARLGVTISCLQQRSFSIKPALPR
jgi:hypothetical protein